jgi:hypothetical protein
MRLANDTVVCDYTVKLMELEEQMGLSNGDLVDIFVDEVMSGESPDRAFYATKARAVFIQR